MHHEVAKAKRGIIQMHYTNLLLIFIKQITDKKHNTYNNVTPVL